MIERQKRIYREIISNYDGTTLADLVELTGVGEKTVRNDIRQIENSMREYDGRSFCYEGRRVFIPFEQKHDYLSTYDSLTARDYGERLDNEQADREVGIAIDLVEADGYLSMEHLSEQYYISKATVHNLVHRIDAACHEGLCGRLEISPRLGVSFRGTERDRRRLLCRYFSRRKRMAIGNMYLNSYLSPELTDKADRLADILDEFLDVRGMALSDDDTYMVILHTLVTAQRNLEGHALENPPTPDQLRCDYARCLQHVGIDIAASELTYIAFPDRAREVAPQARAYRMVTTLLQALNDRYGTKFVVNHDMNSLMLHLEKLLETGERQTEQGSEVYESVLDNCLCAYLISGSLYNQIENVFGHKLLPETRCYIALYVQTLIQAQAPAPQTLLFFEPVLSLSQLVTQQLRDRLGTRVRILQVRSRWHIFRAIRQERPQLIVASKAMPIDFDGVPFERIHEPPTEAEWNRVERILQREAPARIDEAECLEDGTVVADGSSLAFDHAVHEVKGLRLTCTESDEVQTGIYLVRGEMPPLYVLNYRRGDSFIRYSRMVNAFGRQTFGEH